MKWSWTIGRPAGIELRVHATFLMLLAWLAIVDYRAAGTLVAALIGVLFTLALFGSVLLHELGHAVVARRLGVPTRDITLLPIGGVARLEYIPNKPRQELGIALAGPAVTLVIVLVLAAALRLSGTPLMVQEDPITHASLGGFVAELMMMNTALLVFNLLPAFPMDGGRVLRASLALRMDYERATEIAARLGRGFALIFGIVGLLYNPLLVLVALFIWVSAVTEAAELQQRTALTGVPVNRLMVRDVRTLAPNDTLGDALQFVLTAFQHDFPVVDDGKPVGVLTHAALLRGLAMGGTHMPVFPAMDRSFRTTSPDEPVNQAIARLNESRCTVLPVVTEGRLCGLFTKDSIAELMMAESALHASAGETRRIALRPLRLHTANRTS